LRSSDMNAIVDPCKFTMKRLRLDSILKWILQNQYLPSK